MGWEKDNPMTNRERLSPEKAELRRQSLVIAKQFDEEEARKEAAENQ